MMRILRDFLLVPGYHVEQAAHERKIMDLKIISLNCLRNRTWEMDPF